ncbi:GH32 C-terminal domain-containing protein [Paenibacillus methanolicus]|uniref:Levanbiose-producing levanase n=1 Tax=Paenibacillus methanolicus TaxID=582686 RepID=A0A5S5C9G0_9BACL|nr:GH32 C-terminal domain-containing protein [Paenibacillus methanolicus]TYP74623.1 levanbiose-producing levanase [Paenibacillus methanolicus]
MSWNKGLPALLAIALLLGSVPLAAASSAAGNPAAEPAATSTAKEDTSIFVSATKANSDLSGWTNKGKGKLEDTSQGLVLTSDPTENVFAISDTRADDFVYEADVQITDLKADATLVFRSDANGWSSYMLQLVPQAGLIRLKNASGQGLFEERQVSVAAGGIYHLKVKAEGDALKVYWGDRYKPIIDAKDAAYRGGYLGLHVWDGSTVFQNVRISGLNGNLGAAAYRAGAWQPDLRGAKGTGTASQQAVQMYGVSDGDFVYEGDIAFGSDAGEAALRFRGDERGLSGYAVALRRENGQVRAQLKKASGAVIATSARAYPSQPGARHHLEISAVGSRIQLFVDGYATAAISVTDGSYASGRTGLSVASGTAYFQNTYITAAADYYTEKYRPAYHYSPARGSASDPNGLVYYEGEYHLFHQDGGTWAHAVSTDLAHWKRLPIALPWNEHGHVWSGSAIADDNNASGLFTASGGKGLIAYYTSFNPDLPGGNQRIGIAYSTDRGRTWVYPEARPIVIENPGKQGDDPGGWDFRDPKVVRDAANNRWIMVVSGGDHIRFFASTNLLDWTLTDNFGYGAYVRGGVWECPDLFPMKVEGTGETKWVLMISTGANPKTQGSDAEYFVGSLTAEGKFVNDNPAGRVLRTDYGKEFYASMSFAGLPNDRRVMVAWMTNWDYPFAFPTAGWKGEISLPREVTLKRTAEGLRLAQAPVKELQSLRKEIYSAANREVRPTSANLLEGLTSGAYEIEAEIAIPAGSSVQEFGFHLREGADERTVAAYDVAGARMIVDRSASGETDFSSLFSTRHEGPLAPTGGRVKLRIFVDESSVELFAGDGTVVFSDLIFPDPASRGMRFYAKGGSVNVVSLKAYALSNVWNAAAGESTRVMMDTAGRELSLGSSETLNAALDKGKGSGAQPLQWRSSNSAVIRIEKADNKHAVIRAAGEGEAVVTVSTPNGKTSARVPVSVSDGEFRSNLTGWEPDLSASRWIATEYGIRGSYGSDANYMAQEQAGDFTYEADMRLGESGGAGSLLFRASRDGRSGYYFNLDPNMKAFRLFYKADGAFADRQVLAKVPAFVQPGRTYRVKIVAEGPHLRIDVDGATIIDLRDGTFAEGHFGVNVFGGQAYYQEVNASAMQPASLQRASIANAGTTKFLYVAASRNGEPVTAKEAEAGASGRTWVLVPTGDEQGSYSIRTSEGKVLDLDTGQNKIQLYAYLGFNNQRWIVRRHEDGTVSILSAHHGKALEAAETGDGLTLSDPDPAQERQKWRLETVR